MRTNITMTMATFGVLVCCTQLVIGTTWYDGLPLGSFTNRTASEQMHWRRNQGNQLMQYVGISAGDSTLVCTNWACPTSIVVNAIRYDVVTNWWRGDFEFDIMTTNSQPERIAGGEIECFENGLESRAAAFADISCTSMPMDMYAQGVLVQPIDTETNMLFLTHIDSHPQSWKRLIYKNICIRYSAASATTNSVATNALAFTAALINEGLPEEDRVPLSPTP